MTLRRGREALIKSFFYEYRGKKNRESRHRVFRKEIDDLSMDRQRGQTTRECKDGIRIRLPAEITEEGRI